MMVYTGYVGTPYGGHQVRRVWRPLLVGIAGLLAFSFVGCGPPKITSQVLLPGKSHEASQIKRVAVLPFSGTSDMSSDVEAMLVNTRVSGQPYFTVVERTALNKVMTEQAISLSGTIDDTTAAKVGKLVGAEGVIMGVVKTEVAQKLYQETRSRCVSKDQKGKCTSTQDYTVQCKKRDAYFSFTPKIVSVATGRIVASEVLVGQNSQQTWADSSPDSDAVTGLVKTLMGGDTKKANTGMQSDGEMLGAAKQEALNKFREMIAPHYVNRQFVILEGDDTNPPAAAKDKITQSIQWAKEGRLDRACEIWQDAYGLHSQGYAIHYDLGLCAEMVGKLPEALEYYEKADRLTGKPVKEINEALGRVRRSIVQQKQIEEQMQKDVNTPATTEAPRQVPVTPAQQRLQRKGGSQQ
jgi:curli biogenesis system outer membrane secretion channel CsgG